MEKYKYIFVTKYPLHGDEFNGIESVLFASAKEHGVNNPRIDGCEIEKWEGEKHGKGVYWWYV